jgi:hypothetical protein
MATFKLTSGVHSVSFLRWTYAAWLSYAQGLSYKVGFLWLEQLVFTEGIPAVPVNMGFDGSGSPGRRSRDSQRRDERIFQRNPIRNLRLLFLVRLYFTTSTKYCGFSRLDALKGVLLVHVAPGCPSWSSHSHIFHPWTVRLLTHRFPTRIIRGSPDLFAFYTLSRIRIPSTVFLETIAWKAKKVSKQNKRSQIFMA